MAFFTISITNLDVYVSKLTGLTIHTLSKVKTLSICFPAMFWDTATSLLYSLQVITCGALLRNSSSLNGLRKKREQKDIYVLHCVLSNPKIKNKKIKTQLRELILDHQKNKHKENKF